MYFLILKLFYFIKKKTHIQPATDNYEDWSPPIPIHISKKKVRATRNFIKDIMTGRVGIQGRIFEKNTKK